MESLTNEQLCALAQSGDEQAKEQLIKNNLLFVRKTADKFVTSPYREEQLAICGIAIDDLVQAGIIGLWKAIDSYDSSIENKFLTYAAPAIKHKMLDLIEQYSRDTVWRLRTNEVQPWQIVYLDKPLDDLGENTIESVIASFCTKLPEQTCIEQEAMVELHEAMNALSARENMYIRYRFGFANDPHSLIDTAVHFHLSESRAKGVEQSTLKSLKHELLAAIPERAIAKAEDRLTKALVDAGELHSVELRLKSQKKRGRKIITAVYEYLADCGGKWGELSYNFKNDMAKILLLAEWDTMLSHRFAMQAIEYLRVHRYDKLLDKIILTFIGFEQIQLRASKCRSSKMDIDILSHSAYNNSVEQECSVEKCSATSSADHL